MEKTEASWLEYSRYVLLTIERLVDDVAKNEQEVSRFREKLVKDLTKLKEEIRRDVTDSQKGRDKVLDKALSKIDKLILDLSDRTMSLEKMDTEHIVEHELSLFRENYITPLRIKVAVISIMLGAIGGIIVQLLNTVFGSWFVG